VIYVTGLGYDAPVKDSYMDCGVECQNDRVCGEACHQVTVYDYSSAPWQVKYFQTGYSSILILIAGVILLIGALVPPKEKKRKLPPQTEVELEQSRLQEEQEEYTTSALTTESVQCPICESNTILRTVKKGKETGKQFHVCINYPECKGRVQL